jgi:hypothetical protein
MAAIIRIHPLFPLPCKDIDISKADVTGFTPLHVAAKL